MSNVTDFFSILKFTQEYISQYYSSVLNLNSKYDKNDKKTQLKAYIKKYLRDNDYIVDGMTFEVLTENIYLEMAEYSIITKYLIPPLSNDIEEININSWEDIAVTMIDGSIRKLEECFHSPQHATDIIKRLLHHSGMIIDDATPIAQGHLPNNARITAIKTPLVDEEIGMAASIRLLHPQRITRDMLLKTESASEEMLDFLTTCIRYGVSTVIAGATSSGKTTLLNCLLGEIPNEKRMFTIESGARELSLIKSSDGKVQNNVVHTLSKASDNLKYDIPQEKLVVTSLRFSPTVVVIGEMRDTEAHAAVEESLTGHTVVSTVHSLAASAAHMRIALLCQKKFPIDFNTSLAQAGLAFPLVVYTHKLENNARKIMDISECVILPNGQRSYRTLYRYNIKKNTLIDGKYNIEGFFSKPECMSESLKLRLTQYGIPHDVLCRYTCI